MDVCDYKLDLLHIKARVGGCVRGAGDWRKTLWSDSVAEYNTNFKVSVSNRLWKPLELTIFNLAAIMLTQEKFCFTYAHGR